MKNPLTLAGIEPAIFRLVEQNLNHCVTAAPALLGIRRNHKRNLNKIEETFGELEDVRRGKHVLQTGYEIMKLTVEDT
jgi:hypothetical protein